MSYRRRLDDIEPSKKYKAQQERLPCNRRRDQSNELASDFINHDELRIFRPLARATRVAAGIPTRTTAVANETAIQGCHAGAIERARTTREKPSQPSPRFRAQDASGRCRRT